MQTTTKLKIVAFMILIFLNTSAQGKYSGDFKKIIGTKYYTEKDIPLLDNYTYFGGSIISDSIDSYYLSLEVFRKGKTAIIILSKLIDKETKKRSIIEVLKIIDVPKTYEIRTFGCTSKNSNPDDKIVAVINSSSRKKIKFIKESYILKDIRFEKINAKTIKCIDEI